MFRYDGPYLFYLVGLRIIAISLQVDFLFHTGPPKDVVATFRPLREPQALKDRTQIIETDRRIRSATENLLKRFLGAHPDILLGSRHLGGIRRTACR